MKDGDKSEQDTGEPAASPATGKRGRGRPSKGEPVLVRMSVEERAFADGLGGGVAAEGVRMALNEIKRVGWAAVKAMADAVEPRLAETPLPLIIDFPTLPPLPTIDQASASGTKLRVVRQTSQT